MKATIGGKRVKDKFGTKATNWKKSKIWYKEVMEQINAITSMKVRQGDKEKKYTILYTIIPGM